MLSAQTVDRNWRLGSDLTDAERSKKETDDRKRARRGPGHFVAPAAMTLFVDEGEPGCRASNIARAMGQRHSRCRRWRLSKEAALGDQVVRERFSSGVRPIRCQRPGDDPAAGSDDWALAPAGSIASARKLGATDPQGVSRTRGDRYQHERQDAPGQLVG